MLENKIQRHLNLLIDRYPQLSVCKGDIEKAYLILKECYRNDHKLLIAGNGESAADSEHIAGGVDEETQHTSSSSSLFSREVEIY